MIDLNDMEKMVNDGGTEQMPSPFTEPAPVRSPASSPSPRASGFDGGGDTLKAQALQGLPSEWRERLIADAGAAGVRHDNDVGWLLVGSVVHSAMAAFAAGNAAQAVQAGVSSIPDKIFDGAIRAGDEIRGALSKEIRDRSVEAGAALKLLIDSSAKNGAESLKNAGADLENRLNLLPSDMDKLVDKKTREGVNVFAEAAALAASKAASAASARQYLGTVAGVGITLILFAILGAGVSYEYMNLTHRIAPAQIIVNPATGKMNCGEITMNHVEKQRVCEIM